MTVVTTGVSLDARAELALKDVLWAMQISSAQPSGRLHARARDRAKRWGLARYSKSSGWQITAEGIVWMQHNTAIMDSEGL